MDPERWRQIDELLQSALRLPSDERTKFLRQACGGDAALEHEVQSLLISQREIDNFLDRPAFELAAEQMARGDPAQLLAFDAQPGQSIGPYHLIERLGSGGMGEVWRAEQSEPIRRTVALKLIKAGMDTRAVVARFDSERQALATMDHPNIAKVFDAGATPAGRPFFVMELVPGVSITSYCDDHRLTIQQRLLVFLQVCEGVQHAHQKAIIHRDLKPSNILVEEVDGKPVPKIIDFGLAKAATDDGATRSMFTEAGMMVGTPSYMSPEQAGSLDATIDTRTDVYSLGVILFELLVGAPPFDSKDVRRSGAEAMLRQIRESEAPRPSVKFAALGAASQEASVRGERPAVVLRQLRGDLDWITLKAIEKERSRRYSSTSELAADIRRHLDDQPVLAGPPSAAYRARKFVRRHRIAVAIVGAAAAAGIAVAANIVVQARRVARERDRAEREAVAAKSVSDFLVGLFAVSDPSQARGNSVTAREILDRGRDQIETQLSGQPEVQARMMDTIGQVYVSLGLYQQAEPLLQRALAARRSLLGRQHPDTLATMDHLGRNFERLGRYEESEKLVREVLDTRLQLLGPNHPDTIAARHGLIVLTIDKGDFAAAEKLTREELEILRRIRGPEDATAIASMYNLALVVGNQRRSAEAIELYRQLLDIERRVLGPTHPDTLTTMSSFGHLLTSAGQYAEAEKLLRENLDDKRRILGPEHSETLWAMHDLALTLREGGHPAEAESLERQTLAMRRRVLGPEHPETLSSMNQLSADLDDLHRYAEAEPLYRQTIEIQQRVLGANHPDTANTKYNLACNLALTGRRREAIATLADAVDHGLTAGVASGIERDADFKSLQHEPGFVALVARIRRAVRSAPPQ
jgi:eukaryotic-like serine/threonine-protein kinase